MAARAFLDVRAMPEKTQKTEEKNKLCFVVGPIGEPDSEVRIHANWLLDEIIQPVMKEFEGFEVKRADQIAEPGLIDSQVITALLDADRSSWRAALLGWM